LERVEGEKETEERMSMRHSVGMLSKETEGDLIEEAIAVYEES